MSATFDLDLDPEILAAARRGERAGQAAIYRQFERAAYGLARRMSQCPDTASDILQNSFLRAFRVLDQFRGEAPFGHWLRRIVATEALTQLREQRRWRELFVPEAVEDCTVGVEDVSQVDLERALALLPPVPRSVLWLYHVEGYTHAEIAEASGKTASFSKSQLARAHQKLRELLRVTPLSGTAAGGPTLMEVA
ncbi:MAG TPA: sigma-70 family RNA polymerase sigma factor [Solimonas sp.]|nr:sigma-70 family RNA polymerase sigma factor [Solimonas sp.]